jgi:hypothetical protein
MQLAHQQRNKKGGTRRQETDAQAPRDGAEGNGDLKRNDYTTKANYNSGVRSDV